MRAELEAISAAWDGTIKEQERTVERIRKVVNQEAWAEPFPGVLSRAQKDLTRMLVESNAALALRKEEWERRLRTEML